MSGPRAWVFSDAPYAGGAERYLELLLRGAGPARLGLVAVDGDGLRPWIRARVDEGFTVEVIEGASRTDLWRGWSAWVRVHRPYVVHVNMPGPYDGLLATAPWIARRSGARRVVVTEHLPGVGRVGRRYWWKRAFLSGVDHAIVVTHAHLDLMAHVFGYPEGRVTAIANGIADPRPEGATGRSRMHLPADLVGREGSPGLRFLQLGSLDARKGPDRTLRAFAAACARGLRGTLWFVGEGPMRSELEALARDLGRERDVVFTGHRDDVHALLAASDVVVLASEREGLPFSLVEASAHARPIVATDVDGVGEVVEHGVTGVLVALHRPGDLVEALLATCDDERRHAWGDAARLRFQERFGLRRMLDRTFDLYGTDALT